MLPQLLTASALPAFDRVAFSDTELEKTPFLAKPTFDPRAFPHRRWPIHGSRLDLDCWDLRVFGAVTDELRFKWNDLAGLPESQLKVDVGLTSISRQIRHWHGVDAWSVLTLAGVRGDADWLIVHCEGGYSHVLELDRFFEGPVVLARGVDGRALNRREGGPLRMILPQFAPWQNAKWVRGLELTAERPS